MSDKSHLLRAIREEAVTASDLLVAILDLLEERLPSNPGAVSRPESDAQPDSVPTDPATHERAADRMRADKVEPHRVHDHGIDPTCRERVGSDGLLRGECIDTAPDADPDEALARAMFAAEGPLAGELDAAVWYRQFEKEKARAEKAEAERDALYRFRAALMEAHSLLNPTEGDQS